MIYRIRSLRVANVALVFATTFASLYAGFFFVAFILMIFLKPRSTGSISGGLISLAVVPIVIFGFFWLIVYPLSALFCWTYNRVASFTGGIEFKLAARE